MYFCSILPLGRAHTFIQDFTLLLTGNLALVSMLLANGDHIYSSLICELPTGRHVSNIPG